MTRSGPALLAVLAVAALPSPPLAAGSTAATDPEEMVRQVFLTWSDHRIEPLDALFAADGVYEEVPPNKVYRGAEEIKGFVAAIWSWAPDISFTPTSVVDLGDTVVAEWTIGGHADRGHWWFPASGKSFSVRGASVVQFDGGKITRQSDCYDLATLVVQFGVRFAAQPPPYQPED